MKPNDFAVQLSKFLMVYLPSVRGCSKLTVDSYGIAFIQFLKYMQEHYNIRPDRLSFNEYTQENVFDFLDSIEKGGVSVSTRNQRLAAFKSFSRFLILREPRHMAECERIIAIPLKSHPEPVVSFMEDAGMKLMLSQPDTRTRYGMRDHLILSLLFAEGLRVSELIEIRVKDFSFQQPYTLSVIGKGGKGRMIPVPRQIMELVRKYMEAEGLFGNEHLSDYLLKSHHKEPFTRQGINYLVRKYAKAARKIDPSLVPEDCSPHKFRHSCAMSLLRSDVELIYIRDFLGHSSVTTTEIYAKADTRKKNEALEKAAESILGKEEKAVWVGDSSMLKWLKEISEE